MIPIMLGVALFALGLLVGAALGIIRAYNSVCEELEIPKSQRHMLNDTFLPRLRRHSVKLSEELDGIFLRIEDDD